MPRAILIDATNRTISDVDLPRANEKIGYKAFNAEIYKLLGCDLITTAFTFPNEDTLYVDDEGLLKERTADSPWFALRNMSQPFAGSGILVGIERTDDGEVADVKADLQAIKDLVVFLRENDVARWVDRIGTNPFIVTVASGDDPPKVIASFDVHRDPNSAA